MGRYAHFLCARDRIQSPLDIGLTPLSSIALHYGLVYMICMVQIQESACMMAALVWESRNLLSSESANMGTMNVYITVYTQTRI